MFEPGSGIWGVPTSCLATTNAMLCPGMTGGTSGDPEQLVCDLT